MDNVHEMAAELFMRIMANRTARSPADALDARDAAHESYIYAKAFFDEHRRQLKFGANGRRPDESWRVAHVA